MESEMTASEARAALDSVARDRQRVIDEIGLPRWYWWGLALGWVALGYLTDLKHAWVTAIATLAFGAVHSVVAPHVVNGRRRTRSLSVSRELAGPRIPAVVFGGLIALAGVTAFGAVLASADGARHPVTIASLFVAVLILLGGPHLLASVRRKAAQRIASS